MSENIKLNAWEAAEEIVNLRRENAALRELISTLGAPNHINVPVEQWLELRADKERLDWMQEVKLTVLHHAANVYGRGAKSPCTRAAIDAARKEAKS